MVYRDDITGIRGLSVLIVIAFHSGLSLFSGGYVGVDVFFVISGFVITSGVINGVNGGCFSLFGFLARRIVRLFPSLIISLVLIYLLGFVLLTNKGFDILGKEIFYASIGLVNILFSQGKEYFEQLGNLTLTGHLWSLAVEQQFYIFYAVIVFLIIKIPFREHTHNALRLVLLSAAGISLAVSQGYLGGSHLKAYYTLESRIFELAIGSLLAFSPPLNKNQQLNNIGAIVGVMLVIYAAIRFDAQTQFPGFNALFPVFGAALLLVSLPNSFLRPVFEHKLLTGFGLISYPLYLFHQPIISVIQNFTQLSNALLILFIALVLGSILSLFSYRYVERAFRSSYSLRPRITVFVLCSSLLFCAGVGVYTAKSAGLPDRLRLLNEFAYTASENMRFSFHEQFSEGVVLAEEAPRVLFLGDSVLQQYVVPIIDSLGIRSNDVDIYSRGGCIMLKDANYNDKFASISCSDLRDRLYNSSRRYTTVVLSQYWASYGDSLISEEDHSALGQGELLKWRQPLRATVQHFEEQGANVVVIGPHVYVKGADKIQPNVFLGASGYRRGLDSLEIENIDTLDASNRVFGELVGDLEVKLIFPSQIWCEGRCRLHDGKWSFFMDTKHSTIASDRFVASKMHVLLSDDDI